MQRGDDVSKPRVHGEIQVIHSVSRRVQLPTEEMRGTDGEFGSKQSFLDINININVNTNININPHFNIDSPRVRRL